MVQRWLPGRCKYQILKPIVQGSILFWSSACVLLPMNDRAPESERKAANDASKGDKRRLSPRVGEAECYHHEGKVRTTDAEFIHKFDMLD